jgi:cytidine deaminase
MNPGELEKLIQECHAAKEKAYAPYSKFRVGAAVLCEDGEIIQGCNVENACFCEGLCAERAALVQAVSLGYRKFKAISVTTDVTDEWTYPCGSCRQFITEFAKELDIYLVKTDSTYKKVNVKDLLPHAFQAAFLPD